MGGGLGKNFEKTRHWAGVGLKFGPEGKTKKIKIKIGGQRLRWANRRRASVMVLFFGQPEPARVHGRAAMGSYPSSLKNSGLEQAHRPKVSPLVLIIDIKIDINFLKFNMNNHISIT